MISAKYSATRDRRRERLADAERDRVVAGRVARDLRDVRLQRGDQRQQLGARLRRRRRCAAASARRARPACLARPSARPAGRARPARPSPRLWRPALRVCTFSGLLMMCSSAWFCHRHTPNATASTAALTIRRVRSSSRWSTRLSRSSWPIVRIALAMGLVNLPPRRFRPPARLLRNGRPAMRPAMRGLR